MQKGAQLKVMTMGASIAYGLMSSDENGFRKGLEDLLNENGADATMVGTQWSGDMENNHHEAYPGYKVSKLNNASYHSGAYDLDANVILIHVGTNDCWWVDGEDGTGAARQMGYLLDSIRVRAPDALVLPSTLIPSTDANQDKCLQGFNKALPPVVEEAAGKGQWTYLVEMYDVVPMDEMAPDGTHPTDKGYQLMARQWYDGYVNATDYLCVDHPINATEAASLQDNDGDAEDDESASPLHSAGDALRRLSWLLVPVALWSLAA